MPWERRLRGLTKSLDQSFFQGAYQAISVRPSAVLGRYHQAGYPVNTLQDIRALPDVAVEKVARGAIQRSQRRGAVSGMTLGVGGLISIPPAIMFMLVELVRLGQEIALTYGDDCHSGQGEIRLWKNLAQALGVQVDVEGSSIQVAAKPASGDAASARTVNPIVLGIGEAVIRQLLVRFAGRAGRWVPLLGAGVGGVGNALQLAGVGKQLAEAYRVRWELSRFDAGQSIEVEVHE